MQFKPEKYDHIRGTAIAFAVLISWLAGLIFLFTRSLPEELIWIIPGILVMTFLYTGLFITAHDSMHGTIAPGYTRINKWLGTIAVRLYAFFSYKNLLKSHRLHHKYPASAEDPDFYGEASGFWRWYFRFLLNYISWQQLLGMAVIFNLLQHLAGVPILNLILFWVVPALLSTVQLFYFGTYLPHKMRPQGYPDQHRCVTNDYPLWLSFISCYHFGYHWEHHEYPWMAWWRLPRARKSVKAHG